MELNSPEQPSFLFEQFSNGRGSSVGPVGLITHHISPELSDAINQHLVERRLDYLRLCPNADDSVGFMRDDYRIKVDVARFSSGEGRAVLQDSVRGHDIFIMSDVLNFGLTMKRFEREAGLSPDDHFQDLLRLVSVARTTASRINVVMPYLYEGRRYRRETRESLDCALMLKQLFSLGVDNLVTFDPHDGRVANAVPRSNFEFFQTSYHLTTAFLELADDVILDNEHFMVVSPDETGINRAIYFSSLMKVPLGIFYRRRNFMRSDTGSNERITKQFLGDDLTGKDVMLVDDMIDSAKAMIECARELKARGARKVFCVASYALFTSGIEATNSAVEEGIITAVLATNLSYHSPKLMAAPWFYEVNVAPYVALLIDAVNHDASLTSLMSPTKRIAALLAKRQANSANLSKGEPL